MKAQDLRIGNLINHVEFGVVKVYGVSNDIVQFEKQGELDVYYCEVKECNPVVLSEEWLLRFGFVKTQIYVGDNELYSLGHGFLQIYEVGGTEIENNQEVREYAVLFAPELPSIHSFIKFIYYIHELQNLYHALTSSELTINQKVK